MNAQLIKIAGREYTAQEIPESAREAIRRLLASLSEEEREELDQMEAEPDPAW